MILHGDCLEQMKKLDDNSVDAIVTDPPYGIRFMGKAWDGADIEKTIQNKARKGELNEADQKRIGKAQSAGLYDVSLKGNSAFQVWTHEWARQALRVLKPGGHLLCFASTRTYHRMASGVEDAGFEIRDQIMWIFGSGFPKSHNIKDGDFKGWGTACASRFFYVAKASKRERNAGLENEIKQKQGARPNSADATGKFPDHDHRPSGGNNHPTVKPIKLMEYLIKLVTPPKGTVLDPFMGSGSTGVACKNLGFNFIGCEMNDEYIEIAKRRIG